MTAKELFKKLIYNKMKPLVVRYDIAGKKFNYDAFSHVQTENINEQIVDVLIDSILFYAFENDELENEYQKNRLADVRKAAIAAYHARVPKTERKEDGLMGELILDMYLRAIYTDAEILYSRVLYRDHVPTKEYKQEIKGYDSICFSCDNNQPKIWLGQVKTGKLDYCLNSIKEDLNKNILKNYLSSSLLIAADINRNKESIMSDIVDGINDIQLDFCTDKDSLYSEMINYLKEKEIVFMMPAMCVFESKNYKVSEKAITAEIESLVKDNLEQFCLENLEGLLTEILFVILPVESLSNLRDKFLHFRTQECNKAI